MAKLAGKVAIVTGASKGIGAAIAQTFGAEGASVVVNYASSREGADRVVKAIEAAGGKAVAVQGDVAKPADVKRLFAETKSAFGRLDVLVNNAGVFAFAPLASVTEDEYRRQFDINVLGTLLTAQAAAEAFGDGGGSIVNLSSVVSDNPLPDSVVYSASKGAVDTITVTLARELGPRKIRVNGVAPGAVVTEGVQAMGVDLDEFSKMLIPGTPLGRLGKPDDIAKVAVFLASDDSAWVTGETIAVSGGWN